MHENKHTQHILVHIYTQSITIYDAETIKDRSTAQKYLYILHNIQFR